jgi:hypothetical protein
MRTTFGVTICIVRALSSYIQGYKALKINTSHKLLNYNKPGENDFGLAHSCHRGVVHFPAHKTTLLALTLRHSNTIKNNMNADSTKDKKQKPKDNHITLVTNPTNLVQPYKTTSSEHTLPNGENSQHKKSNTTLLLLTPTPVCNPVFH